MGIRVNDTSRARQTQRNINLNKLLLSKSFERLSSGLKINRASDDAAGLSISSRMDSQIRGLVRRFATPAMASPRRRQRTRHGSVVESARIRELSVQAANGTLNSADRKSIQVEIDQLTDEIVAKEQLSMDVSC